MEYDTDAGQFKLSGSFAQHKAECQQCQQHNESPATLSLLCLEGSVLWKNENAVAIKREPPARSDHWRPMPQVKAAMRYK